MRMIRRRHHRRLKGYCRGSSVFVVFVNELQLGKQANSFSSLGFHRVDTDSCIKCFYVGRRFDFDLLLLMLIY